MSRAPGTSHWACRLASFGQRLVRLRPSSIRAWPIPVAHWPLWPRQVWRSSRKCCRSGAKKRLKHGSGKAQQLQQDHPLAVALAVCWWCRGQQWVRLEDVSSGTALLLWSQSHQSHTVSGTMMRVSCGQPGITRIRYFFGADCPCRWVVSHLCLELQS